MNADYKQKILKLNERMELLDRKFNLYFSGRDRVPPIRDLDQLKREIIILSRERDRVTSSSKRFYINNFLQRFGSYRTKWEKALKDIEEGRSRPGAAFFTGRGTPPASPQTSGHGQGNASHLDKEIDLAAKKYSELYEKHLGKKCQPASVKRHLKKKIDGLKEKVGTHVAFDVHFDGKEIVVKPVKKREEAS